MKSIYDIVYYYMDTFFPDERLTNDDAKQIHKEIAGLLDKGWCIDEILDVFKKHAKNRYELHPKKFFQGKRPVKKNLLKQKTFYYHNALRSTVGVPVRKMDYDSGEIVSVPQEYFLEMRASYSVEDLLGYYAKHLGIKMDSIRQKRFIGGLNWLLQQYDVEHILFMIDEAINSSRSEDLKPPKNTLDIKEYEDEAIIARNLKKTEAVISGGNKVVRKKRVHRGRNGD